MNDSKHHQEEKKYIQVRKEKWKKKKQWKICCRKKERKKVIKNLKIKVVRRQKERENRRKVLKERKKERKKFSVYICLKGRKIGKLRIKPAKYTLKKTVCKIQITQAKQTWTSWYTHAHRLTVFVQQEFFPHLIFLYYRWSHDTQFYINAIKFLPKTSHHHALVSLKTWFFS